MYHFKTKKHSFNYTIHQVQNTTNVQISVCKDEGVLLTVPKSFTKSNLQFVLARKADWIAEQLGDVQTSEENHTQNEEKITEAENVVTSDEKKSFQSGERFFYLGRQYRLNIETTEDTPSFAFKYSKFTAQIPTSWDEAKTNEEIFTMLKEWYITKGHDKTKDILKSLNPLLTNDVASITWEESPNLVSYNNGDVKADWHLLMAPMATIEAVIAKEVEQNPSSLFEDYNERLEWLKEHTLSL